MKIRATAIEPAELMINNNVSVVVNAKGLTPVAKMNVSSQSWIAGKSAYQVWLDQGNTGTEQDFLDSLKSNVSVSYIHTQVVPENVWTVTHNLGYYPGGIMVIDTAGSEWRGQITHLDTNSLTITFGSGGFAGIAYIS